MKILGIILLLPITGLIGMFVWAWLLDIFMKYEPSSGPTGGHFEFNWELLIMVVVVILAIIGISII